MTAAALRPGDPRTVGPFLLTGRLGSGGSGTVFAGLDAAGTRVAVKVLRPDLLDGPEGATLRARAAREVEALRRAPVHGVARLVAADLTAPEPWIATELLTGPTLHERVNRSGPLPTDELIRAATDVLATLAGLHAAGVVHRDLKPANVVLSREAAVVLDFGIADVAGAGRLTGKGATVGSPGWMAPEQATGGTVGPAADLWNWAMLVSFAATGRPPFGTGRPEAVMYRMLHQPPDLAGVPPTMLPVVVAALQREPKARPAASTALAWTARLGTGGPRSATGVPRRRVVRSAPVRTTGHDPDTVAVARPAATAVLPVAAGAGQAAPRRRRRRAMAAAAVTVVVVGGGAAVARSTGLLGGETSVSTPREQAARLVRALDATRVPLGSQRSGTGTSVDWWSGDGPRPAGWVGSVEFQLPRDAAARVHVFVSPAAAKSWLDARPKPHGPFSHTTVAGVTARRAYSVGFFGVTTTTTVQAGRTVVVARSSRQGFATSFLDGISDSDPATDLAAATARVVRSSG